MPSIEYEERCYACGRLIKGDRPKLADTRDGQYVFVGPDCYKKIVKAGDNGYLPPVKGKGRITGPRLWVMPRHRHQLDEKQIAFIPAQLLEELYGPAT